MNDQKAFRRKRQNSKSALNSLAQMSALFLLLVLSPCCKRDNVEAIPEVTITTLVSDEAKLIPRKGIVVNSNCHGYYEYVPHGYNSSASAQYPLIIFFHGSGELGNGTSDLSVVSLNDLPRRIANNTFPDSFLVDNKEYRFIVIAPQFISPPSTSDADDVLTFVRRHYKVDATRIYLTGLSLGGGVVWAFASSSRANARKIAAIVPVCGAYFLSASEAKVIATEGLMVWATHNNNDPNVQSALTIGNVDLINGEIPSSGVKAKYSIFNSTLHDAWSKTYDPSFTEDNLNVYQWMLQFHR